MTTTAHPDRTWVRVINGLVALALAALLLAAYWPMVRVLNLHTADLMYGGEWIGDHSRLITSVTAGGPAASVGLRAGDVLLFDPSRDADWVLAGYHNMPAGFTATIPVRHSDGTESIVTLAPARVAYAPMLNDRLALLARLSGLTVALLIGALLVWARPCLMTWSLFLMVLGTAPGLILVVYYTAFSTPATSGPLVRVAAALLALCTFGVPFGFSFPRDTVTQWPRWVRALGCAAVIAIATIFALLVFVPFERDLSPIFVLWVPMAILATVVALFALVRTYRGIEAAERARLRWAILGMSGVLVVSLAGVIFIALAQAFPNWRSGNPLTPAHWALFIGQGLLLPLTMAYAILRQRVVDVQFAVSRTVVYGVVSTIVLFFLAVLHWLLGRVIEHSRLAFGVEGLAAVGLGLVLHRASHGINRFVDRVLFRKHHAAEERLRQVTAALPYAMTERSIAEALVNEPARNLDLTSAALFYRASMEGPLRRVLSHGWEDDHATSLDAESMLVRYLQAEHTSLRLEAVQWLPSGMPEGVAHPVLAIPIVNQHALTAVVLYGGHVNGTLLDPDEIELLSALGKAAATSHQQVRIAILAREKAAVEREAEMQMARNAQLEASLRLLAQERSGAQS